MPKSTLSDALTSLENAAEKANVPLDVARREGECLAAAVAESSTGAFVDWCRETGREISAVDFMAAASEGRRYRTSPTALMSQLRGSQPALASSYATALTDVCAAACALGTASSLTAGAASVASAAQAGLAPTPSTSVSTTSAPPPDFAERAPGMLNSVLSQLRQSQQRLADLGLKTEPVPPVLSVNPFDVAAPSGPGAFDLTGANPAAPTTTATALPQAEEPTDQAEPSTPEEAKSVEELLAELDGLIGLATVKDEIHRQSAILRIEGLRSKEGLKSPTITRHLVFVGNPGTGKTTVARLVAGIYRALGLLSKGQLIEVDRSELVAGYLGQTAIKVAEVVEKAAGGVLFIDEAYALNGDQYGEEAINTLVKEMEDRRDDLVVIVAGYPAPMSTFIDNNPGLASRFRTTIEFDDYTDDEVVEILKKMAADTDYDLGEGTEGKFRSLLERQVRDQTFGNGRFARNMLEAAIGRHAWRLRDDADITVEDLRTLLPADFEAPADVVEWPAVTADGTLTPSEPTSQDTPDTGERPVV